MTTEDLKTNGYAIEFVQGKDSLERLNAVISEVNGREIRCTGAHKYYGLYHCSDSTAHSTTHPMIPLSEVKLMSEVLPLPRMVEVKNCTAHQWQPRLLLSVLDDKYRRKYVAETEDGKSADTFLFMRELNPNRETLETIARLETELQTLKDSLI